MEEYQEDIEQEDQETLEPQEDYSEFLSMARDAHDQGESFLEMSMYSKWRKSYN